EASARHMGHGLSISIVRLPGDRPRRSPVRPLGPRRERRGPAALQGVAFDYFVIFDPNSIVPEIEAAFPGRGKEFVHLWRTRQFEYAWLRSITNRYVDFFRVTEDALVYTANALQLDLTPERKTSLLNAYMHLKPWPDAEASLRKLKDAGVRVITI